MFLVKIYIEKRKFSLGVNLKIKAA